MEHTKGPWKAEKFCIWQGETYIAGTQTGIDEETQQANARLIAEAPNMLDALKGIIRNAGYESGEADVSLRALNVSRVYLDAARAAIEAATS